jgi:antirestriction protein ArdC
LAKLRNDGRMVVLAAAQAQKAADYILNGQSAAE